MYFFRELLTGLGLKRTKRKRSDPAQHPGELPALLRLAEGAKSYLEVGTRNGGTFNVVMRSMPKGSRGVAIDLPGGLWGVDSLPDLESVTVALRADGYDIHVLLGDSTAPEIIEQARRLGPFDLALIDGDHRYDGVKADWLNYGPMCETVVFHDIAGDRQKAQDALLHVDVPRLWREIKSTEVHTREVIGRRSKMGLGIVQRA